MDKPAGTDRSVESAAQRRASPEAEFADLRSLLLGPEREQLKRLQRRLENTGQRTKDVSQVLPEAIVDRSQRDGRLTTALIPTVETIVRQSVQRNPRPLADALFPIIGPAIRKSIAETFRHLIASINQSLEHSLSLQGLKWRWTAMRTGKSFAEIVLLNSLVYRVEQVFLIHRQTGILLEHVVADSVTPQDADMVSAMLTAIEDFVRDSFRSPENDSLETIQVGDLTIVIEQGPLAVMAGVIRGTPPPALRAIFRESLENIHLQLASPLAAFDGDTEPFAAAQVHLQSGLQAQYQSRQRKMSPLFWVLLALIALGAGLWGAHIYRQRTAWSDYLQRLKAEPGIVVTRTAKRNGKYRIEGLRDPLAADPLAILKTSALDTTRVEGRWEPYQALNDAFILQRAHRMLQPPESVTLSLGDQILTAAGAATAQWVDDSRRLVRALTGINAYRDDQVGVIDSDGAQLMRLNEILQPPDTIALAFSDGRLIADGHATHTWIAATRKRVEDSPVVRDYDDSRVTDADAQAYERIREHIDTAVVRFGADTELASPAQMVQVERVAAHILDLAPLAGTLSRPMRVQVVGHTDSIGSTYDNRALSLRRAQAAEKLLVDQGVAPELLSLVAAGETQPLPGVEPGSKQNRRISFHVVTDQGQE